MVYNACQGNMSGISRSLSEEEIEIQRRKVKILWQDMADFVKPVGPKRRGFRGASRSKL